MIWILFFVKIWSLPWSLGSWENAWAHDWRSDKTLVWTSGPGSMLGDITREIRNSANSWLHTNSRNSLLQFLTQDSNTINVSNVDLWNFPAHCSSLYKKMGLFNSEFYFILNNWKPFFDGSNSLFWTMSWIVDDVTDCNSSIPVFRDKVIISSL